MKKVLALLVVAACAMPVFAGAQQADNQKMLQIFSAQARPDWGSLNVILLNDRTVEALFGTSPAKAAFRTKARMTSVFFIQGTANKEFAGGKVAKGEQLQGLVELPKKIDLYESFKVTVGGQSVDFNLREDDVRDYGNR